jgi:hypothetical protein
MIPGICEYNDNRILVDHYLMNFLPAIRKIKIDLMMNRKDKDGKAPPKHLASYFEKGVEAAEFNFMDDYILSNYISCQASNKTFFEQSSICKLIDRQFQATRWIYMGLLVFFTIGFIYPFSFGMLFVDGTQNP